jgi:hypothetical protein
MMKNCEFAEFGSAERAMPTVPRLNCALLVNSAGRSGQIGAARAGATCVEAVFHVAELDVAGLRHEAVDDAVEGHVVVGPGAHEGLDPLDMLRREVGPQFDRHHAVLQLDAHGVSGTAA